MRVPCGDLHAVGVCDTGHSLADAAEADDAELLAEQFVAVVAGPVARLDLAVKLSDMACELHQQCHGVFGDGMVAVMHHIADTDDLRLGLLKIDVAGHASAAKRVALGMGAFENRVGAVEADHHNGVGSVATGHDGVLIQCEILIHAYSCNVFQQSETPLERFDHGCNDHRHDDQRQIGAFRLGLNDFDHIWFLSTQLTATLR